ncbi:MAG: immunoglobulin domain-containing protein [Ilumatobacteraceae bacterium]|nr:immunoglobulin domain-containing protein [Ilumatobacteraceae bacterium]
MKVWNDFSMALSSVVNVVVNTDLGVEVIAPEPVDIGGSANLIANASGPGTLSYQWSRGGVEIAGATGETLRISPVTAADRGEYRVKVTSTEGAVVTGTTSTAATLVVRDVPRILMAPLSRTVQASESGTASFKVVAESREGNPLSYTWREVGSAVTLSATGTQNVSTLNVSVGVTAGTVRHYSVTVSSGTSANSGSITLTARLTVLASGSSETKGATAGSDGVSAHTGWWVYWVKATSKSTGEVRNGYYALERELKAGESIVTPKRAVWVWEPAVAGTSVYPVDRWAAGDHQSVIDGVASERGEFSVLASRAVVGGTYEAVDYAIAGRVEEEGEASLYGAPDLVEGVYSAGVNEFTVELGWDMEQVYLLDLIKTQDSVLLDDVEAALKKALGDALTSGD